MPSRAEVLATLPRKRITAGVVIRDDRDRVLLVEPVHRPDWLLPGGTVEADELPVQGAAREVLQELSSALPVGRPLVMQWLREADDVNGVLHFADDGGRVDAAITERVRSPPEELRSCRFVAPEDVPSPADGTTSARVAAALVALERHSFEEI